MAGDRALSFLIDIRARNSTAGIFSALTANFFGLSSAFKLFGEASKLSNLAKLAADAGHADAALFLMGQSAQKSGAAFKELALSGLKLMAVLSLVAVAVAVAIGVAAIKAAGDFQQGLNRLVTGAGDVTDNMNLMGQSILGISTDTGVLTDQLLPAMYQIISAGQRGAQAEDTLAVAARGSVAEQAKIVDVAKALTTGRTLTEHGANPAACQEPGYLFCRRGSSHVYHDQRRYPCRACCDLSTLPLPEYREPDAQGRRCHETVGPQ